MSRNRETTKRVLSVVIWFLLAGYVIWRCTQTVQTEQLDIIFAAWLGGVISLFCVIVASRVIKDIKNRKGT